MSDYVEIVALVEGTTEKIFVSDVLAPDLARKGVFMSPILVSKPGQKGGDVKFARVKNDIGLHLKQRRDTYLTLLVDYYGIKGEWPGLEEAKRKRSAEDKAETINVATKQKVEELFRSHNVERRFIPYVSMHEFEALLFSDPQILARLLHVSTSGIEKILAECGKPENIDDSAMTAPSKRLKSLSDRFKKTSTGIAIAKAIGLPKIRLECPIFNGWLAAVEGLRAEP